MLRVLLCATWNASGLVRGNPHSFQKRANHTLDSDYDKHGKVMGRWCMRDGGGWGGGVLPYAYEMRFDSAHCQLNLSGDVAKTSTYLCMYVCPRNERLDAPAI